MAKQWLHFKYQLTANVSSSVYILCALWFIVQIIEKYSIYQQQPLVLTLELHKNLFKLTYQMKPVEKTRDYGYLPKI